MLFFPDQFVGLVIVGGGPAGFAPLFAAASTRKLQSLLEAGGVVFERSSKVGSGERANQVSRSDSAAEAFIEIVTNTSEPDLAALRSHPTFLRIASQLGNPVPLPDVSDFLRSAAEAMARIIENSPLGRVYRDCTALNSKQVSGDLWDTCFIHNDTGCKMIIRSSSVLLATGASQPQSRLYKEDVAGVPLLPRYTGRVLNSGYVLTPAGLADIEKRLSTKEVAKVAIVGGSASAGSVAQVLLDKTQNDLALANLSITLLHRRPIRIFYRSVEEALAEGYTEWEAKDVCQLTGRIHRLGGLRFDSREVIVRARGIGLRVPDPRVRLHLMTDTNKEDSHRILGDADVVVAALGYIPRALPIAGEKGEVISLLPEGPASGSLVDSRCRVLDSNGLALQGMFAIGLASGRPPTPEIGGEVDFMGQVNSLWLWQHIIGSEIVDQVLTRAGSQHSRYATLHIGHISEACH